MESDNFLNIDERPLVVDVDGTFIRNDLTTDMLVLSFFNFPFQTLCILLKYFNNRPMLKSNLYTLCCKDISVATLPYNEAVLSLLKKQAGKGRRIILCSGSYEPLVKEIAKAFNFITEAYGTVEGVNLTSGRKAEFLKGKFPQGFNYIGNSKDDIAVWLVSSSAYGVNPPRKAFKTLEKNGKTLNVLDNGRRPIKAIIKAMRLHQWIKNSLIFMVPILVFDRLSLSNIPNLLLGFLAFGLLASGTYLFNDLTDISNDRAHHTKRKRPFANGDASVLVGLSVAFVLIAIAFAIAFYINAFFTIVLGTYLVLTLLYSFILKRLAIIDIITLANLFLIRVAAGAAIVYQPLSAWLTCFVLTFFLSLSLVKRYVEVRNAEGQQTGTISGRGYTKDDGVILLSFGVMSVGMTLLFFVLYSLIVENPALTSWFSLLLVGTVLTYWIMRIWLLAYRGQMNEDPVLFAVKDATSIICGICIVSAVVSEKLIGAL